MKQEIAGLEIRVHPDLPDRVLVVVAITPPLARPSFELWDLEGPRAARAALAAIAEHNGLRTLRSWTDLESTVGRWVRPPLSGPYTLRDAAFKRAQAWIASSTPARDGWWIAYDGALSICSERGTLGDYARVSSHDRFETDDAEYALRGHLARVLRKLEDPP